MRHVFVESGFVFACCAPTHRQPPSALSLLKQAADGELTLHLPSICLREGADAIRRKCQPREDDIRGFMRSARATGALGAEESEAGVRLLQSYRTTVSQELEDVQRRVEALRTRAGIDAFPLSDETFKRVFEIRRVPDLKPFDESILAAILVRNDELRKSGVHDSAFVEVDGDLQPWERKSRKRREPLCSLYDDAKIWVYEDFGLQTPTPPGGWPKVCWGGDGWIPE